MAELFNVRSYVAFLKPAMEKVIFVDPAAPTIRKDRKLNWICFNKHKGRVYRGLVHK